MARIQLDLSGLKCPLPALRTRKAFATLEAGDILEVHCTDPMAVIDLPHLVNQSGHRLLSTERTEAKLIFLIEMKSI